MKQNEKSIAANDAFRNLTNELNNQPNNMNSNPNQPIFQPPPITAARTNRELLESTKLSRLPRLPERRPTAFDNTPKPVVVVSTCAGCGVRLDTDDPIQQTFTGCRKCVGIYGRLDAAFAENAERKRKELLEKMTGGFSR